jgi:CheY-like chemotaxis protein
VSPLAGKRVLVVEDEPVIAMTIEDMLADLGCDVVGPAASLVEAQALAEGEPLDAAVLDININGARSYVVADELRRRGVPFVFATGYGEEGIEGGGNGAPVLQKPYRQDQVEEALSALLATVTEP